MISTNAVNSPWLKIYDELGIKAPRSYPNKTLYESVKHSAEINPDKPAVDFMDTVITYSQLLHYIDICADILLTQGIQKGDVVSVCLPNIPQTIFAFYAINKIGAIASMIHPLSSPDEIEAFLVNTSSSCLFALDLLYPRMKANVAKTKVKKVFISRINDHLDFVKSTAFALKNINRPRADKNGAEIVMWKDIAGSKLNPSAYVRNISPKETAVVLFSGGTSSGLPKGIALSSYNFEVLAYNLQSYVPSFTEKTSILTILPLFHGFGLGICVNAILTIGAKLYLVPQFSSDGFVNTIRKKKPEQIAGVPSMFSALITHKQSQNLNLSFLKGAYCGGDTVPPELKARVNDFIKNHGGTVTFREGYGLTEMVTACAITPEKESPLNSFGIPLPNVLMKICEPGTQREVSPRTDGEICICGDSAMLGYLNSPEENLLTLQIHSDGKTWLHTGDMGYMDENGYFYFRQRIKRILKISGFPVYPSAVEDVLLSFPGITLCAVIGMPDEKRGQRVKAYAVLADTSLETEDTKQKIIAYCKEKLNKWSIPAEIEFRASLPLTRVGKVNIVELEKENK